MAGGIHIFGQQNNMMVLKVEHDKEYDLMQIAERFEVPYLDFSTASKQKKILWTSMVEALAKSTAKHAIDTYTRLRHWRYYSSRPPVLDISDAQYDLEEFRSSSQKDFAATTQESIIDKLDRVAYVVKLWFIVPKIRTEVITPEPDDPDVVDGMVNPYNMKEFVELPVEEKVDSNG